MRRSWSIRVILLLAIAGLSLTIAVLVTRDIYIEWQKLARVQSLKQATILSDQLFDVAEKISIERDLAFSALHVSDPAVADDLVRRMRENRRDVRETFKAGMDALALYRLDDLDAEQRQIQAQFASVDELCGQVDAAIAMPLGQRDPALSQRWFDGSTEFIGQMQDLWMDFVKHYTDIDPYVTLHMRFKHILGIIMGYSGRQRALIGRLLAENVDPTPQEQADLLRWAGVVDVGWKISTTLASQSGLAPAITPYFEDARSHYFSVYDMMQDIFYIPGAHTRPYPISVEFWLDLATQADDSLYALKDAAVGESRAYVERLEMHAQRSIAYHAAALLFALGLCLYTLRIIMYRVIRPINAMADALVRATGSPEAMLPDGEHDEIGKLEHALHASQRIMEDMRRTSAELAHYTSALERSNHELDDFAYIASHDLKEPLRGLQNHARFLLEDNAGKLDDDSVARLGRLVYLGERMERLVSDLLYYSRIGRQELAIQPADMNEVIADIRGTLEVFLAERRARVTIPQRMPTYTCDKTRVTEVFRNLITNAIKYNDADDKIVEIGFLEAYPAPDGALCKDVFSVRDNGRGIAPEFHKDIFRMFKRLQKEADAKDEGNGVGLTFVKKIIERHGGAIWLESEPEKGTTFYFTLQGGTHEAKEAA